MNVLLESSELYKGIFWVKDIDNPTTELFFTIPSNVYGNVEATNLTAKSGTTHNHKALWSTLGKVTEGKPYNYFPRGRVEIANRKATVYFNQNLNTEFIKKLIVDTYNLTTRNGIEKVTFIVDGSEHYKSYLG